MVEIYYNIYIYNFALIIYSEYHGIWWDCSWGLYGHIKKNNIIWIFWDVGYKLGISWNMILKKGISPINAEISLIDDRWWQKLLPIDAHINTAGATLDVNILPILDVNRKIMVLEFHFRDESFHLHPPSVLEIANHAALCNWKEGLPPSNRKLDTRNVFLISQHWDWTKHHIHFSWVWFQQKKWHPIIITLHQRVAKLHVSRFSQISRWTEKKTWTTRGHHGFLGHVPMAFHGFPWPCWMLKFRLDGLFIP